MKESPFGQARTFVVGSTQTQFHEEWFDEASEAFARMDKISQVLVTLREARKRKGLTQARVDEISGIGRANVSRLENLHLENPTLETVLRYADAIGVRFNMQVDDPGQ